MTNQLNKRIDLKSLPKAQARVEIAKDVIAALEAKKLIAAPGIYLKTEAKPTVLESLKAQASCEVCALGACFVAVAARGQSDAELDDDGDVKASMYVKLAPWFERDQLQEIEEAFESCDRWRRMGPDARLTAIMQNIIDNKGAFVP